MQIQVKQSYKGKNISSLYRFPFVYSKRPNIGPADYWSLTLYTFVSPHEKTLIRESRIFVITMGVARVKSHVSGAIKRFLPRRETATEPQNLANLTHGPFSSHTSKVPYGAIRTFVSPHEKTLIRESRIFELRVDKLSVLLLHAMYTFISPACRS